MRADGSISQLWIAGHGSGCGCSCKHTNGDNSINIDWNAIKDRADLKDIVALFHKKLAAGAPIILAGCSQAIYLEEMQKIADIFGRPVVANTHGINCGNNGHGYWIIVRPRAPEVEIH
jgi:hypothetical protein